MRALAKQPEGNRQSVVIAHINDFVRPELAALEQSLKRLRQAASDEAEAISETNSGVLVINLDDADDHYEGQVVAIVASDATLPATYGFVSIPKGSRTFSSRIFLTPVDRGTGNPIDREAFAKGSPTIVLPTYADAELTVNQHRRHRRIHRPKGERRKQVISVGHRLAG